MSDFGMQDAEETFHVDKVSKWTIYFLIDLRVLFIIIYVYVSVAHLISTAASSQASSDSSSMILFTVTSNPNHSNVLVSYIDDAVLWNCREHSVTKEYYQGLYSMLFSAFSVTLFILTITKLAILWGNKAGISHLWKIAVVQQLQVTDKSDFEEDYSNNQIVEAYMNLLNKCILAHSFSEMKPVCTCMICYDYCCKMKSFSQIQCYNYFRITTLIISVMLLPSTIFLVFISYDLHPLSCIVGPAEEFIEYDPSTKAVELRYSNNMLLFQKMIGFVILVSAIVLLLNAACFYLLNSIIVNNLKPSVKTYLSEELNKSTRADNNESIADDNEPTADDNEPTVDDNRTAANNDLGATKRETTL